MKIKVSPVSHQPVRCPILGCGACGQAGDFCTTCGVRIFRDILGRLDMARQINAAYPRSEQDKT